MGRTKWAAAVLVIGFAACSSGGSSTSSSKPETRTVRQVASIVSQFKQPFLDRVAVESDCTSIDCLTATNLLSRRKAAAVEAIRFAAALNGTYPREIRALGEKTHQQLIDFYTTDVALEQCGQRTGSLDACRTELDKVDAVFLDQLPATLRAWEPYL